MLRDVSPESTIGQLNKEYVRGVIFIVGDLVTVRESSSSSRSESTSKEGNNLVPTFSVDDVDEARGCSVLLLCESKLRKVLISSVGGT